jgi:hypothetical protein
MDEAVVEVVENTPSTTPVAEPQEPVKTEPEAKSEGGQPAGAKDKAPRKKKVVIVTEDVPETRTKHEKRASAASDTATPTPAVPAPGALPPVAVPSLSAPESWR